uniref:OCIA domain-containing protein 1 n=1 Tax=Oryzias melastigma TaxID=30732 RepID=A0A3B3CAU8_ORYME
MALLLLKVADPFIRIRNSMVLKDQEPKCLQWGWSIKKGEELLQPHTKSHTRAAFISTASGTLPVMTSETIEQAVKTEEAGAADGGPAAGKEGWKCPLSDPHIHRGDVRKVWKECQEESFWYRALPLSLGSMAVTGGLIYNGVWKSSKRFGPFPKLAVAGLLGFAVGKASYFRTCQNKFQELGIKDPREFGPRSDRGRRHPGHRPCNHVCEECKRKAEDVPAEKV